MKKINYLVIFLIVSVMIGYGIYFVSMKKKFDTKINRLEMFTQLLTKVPKKSCLHSIDQFRNQIVNRHNFKEMYAFDLDGKYLGGGSVDYIQEWGKLLDMAVSWNGFGELELDSEKTAYWGRCSIKIVYIAID